MTAQSPFSTGEVIFLLLFPLENGMTPIGTEEDLGRYPLTNKPNVLANSLVQ